MSSSWSHQMRGNLRSRMEPYQGSDRCHALAQAKLAAYRENAAAGAAVDDRFLTQWLKTSFVALPSDEHRHMFLDAATLMHGEPQAHLRATWVAHMQLDFGLTSTAAGFTVSDMLAELVDSSLVTVTRTSDVQDARCGPRATRQRCASYPAQCCFHLLPDGALERLPSSEACMCSRAAVCSRRLQSTCAPCSLARVHRRVHVHDTLRLMATEVISSRSVHGWSIPCTRVAFSHDIHQVCSILCLRSDCTRLGLGRNTATLSFPWAVFRAAPSPCSGAASPSEGRVLQFGRCCCRPSFVFPGYR